MHLHRSTRSPKPIELPCVDWICTPGLVAYQDAVQFMEARVSAIADGRASELVWLLEHPPIYTAGTGAKDYDLLNANRFPVVRTKRGGQFTYHGPGQRVIYVMLDVRKRTGDVRAYVGLLEHWVIATLASLGVIGETRQDRVGVWVPRPWLGDGCEDKIAAIGIRVRHWVSFHGISINVDPDLDHFSGIVPCGISAHGVTSLTDLGCRATMGDVDRALARNFKALIGRINPCDPPSDSAAVGTAN
ncbi:MAG: lipoyl(octanoyl) transferase LipB [Hyphomicrobiaceae bacterium]